jgi:adenylosuccinate lyase
MEDVALWHERDISHSSAERIILPDACLLLDYTLDMFTTIIKNLNVYPKNMKRNLELTKGLVFSQRVMLALIDKSISRQEAYKFVQRNAMESWRSSKKFLTLLEADEELMQRISREDLEAIFDYKFYLAHVDTIFKRLGLTEAQWKTGMANSVKNKLAPRAI